MDRHFLSALESRVGIASIDESVWPSAGPTTTIETLRLILAQKFDNQLNFRELPVSLLRLYFSGKQRLTRFISRLSHPRLNALILLLQQDGLSLPELSPSLVDVYTDPTYTQKCLALQTYLTELLDYAFCSFERTLKRFLDPDATWYRFGLRHSLENDSYWANFPLPSAVEEGRHQILLACLWRMNVTIVLCKLLSPWDDETSREWLTYQCKLFRDTHLDLLSVMLSKTTYDDDRISSTTTTTILRDNYPLCNRVCCAEELPDFVAYATDHFKTGSNLKERSSLDDKIGHIFVGKTGPNICKIRNFYDIIIRYGEEDPIIYELLKNVIKCVLLGNLPHSRGTLNVVARIKINLAFAKGEADAEIPEDVFRELTKNKSMKRTRSKKKTKDELIYTKTNFKLWLLLCRHFVLYLLKEFLFYIAESSHWFNEILSVDYKFTRYREIVLIGNGRCRKKLSQQAKSTPLDSAFDWNVIEFEEKSTETYDTKSGEIKKFHAWSLTVARKIQKDDFMKILAKKMTNTEELIDLSPSYRPFYYVESEGEVASPECIISLADLHFLCWLMAKRKDKAKLGKTETRWFQVMGMSREGLETLRMWYFLYSRYDIPDNSLKKVIMEFHARSPKDYMILKTVLRLIEYYKNEQVFHLPICYAKKQIFALRRLLGVEDWEPTPPLLGCSYQCTGCHKFANAVIEPIDNNRHVATATTATAIMATQAKKGVVGLVSSPPKPCLANGGESAAELQKKRGKRGTTTTTEKNVVTSGTTSCFLNTALFNMDDGRLYCSKYTSGYKHALLENDGYNEGQIVMRKKDGSVVVRSNKTVLLFPNMPQPIIKKPVATATTRKKPHGNSTLAVMSSVREREEKKLLWLLDVRAFELNESSADDVACGLFAANKEIVEGDEVGGDGSTTIKVVPTTTTKKETVPVVPKKNNKKIILGYVTKAITDMKLTCNTPLTCIDMVGIVKNGKVLCVECGSMTEMKNHNITNHGITCGRHKSIYDSDFDATLSTVDRRTTKKQQQATQIDQQDSNFVAMASSGSVAHLSHYNHNGPVSNNVIKNQLHPLDMVQVMATAEHVSHIEGDRCAYCNRSAPKYRVTGVGHQRKIVKVALCKPCYSVCAPFVGKHQLAQLRDIFHHLRARKPL